MKKEKNSQHKFVRVVKLSIKENNLGKTEYCAICGESFDQDLGSALFLANSYDAVCNDCGRKESPVLNRLLKIGKILDEDIWEGLSNKY